jgi:hypothetical protein
VAAIGADAIGVAAGTDAEVAGALLHALAASAAATSRFEIRVSAAAM